MTAKSRELFSASMGQRDKPEGEISSVRKTQLAVLGSKERKGDKAMWVASRG